jgi:hypothetical protein
VLKESPRQTKIAGRQALAMGAGRDCCMLATRGSRRRRLKTCGAACVEADQDKGGAERRGGDEDQRARACLTGRQKPSDERKKARGNRVAAA